MSNVSPFLLVATLVAAMGVGTVSQAHASYDAAHMAELRTAAAHASSVGPGVLVLASR